MPKRYVSLLAACVVFLAAMVVLASLAARTAVAGLLLLAAIVWLTRVFRTKGGTEKFEATGAGVNQSNDASSQEIFALGKLFEATMSGMREGLLVVDKEMRVVASNAAAHRLFNLSRGKLEAQRLTELTRNPAIYSAFLDALKGRERSGVKVETHGPERVFDLRVVPLGNSDGGQRVSKGATGRGPDGIEPTQAAEGALGVFIDITRIERLEHVRQEFLSNVSHELRTPLTAILAFVETLESGALEDQESARRFLTIIRRNAARMQDLIDDILELSAIEAGNVQVRAEEVELWPLVNHVMSSLATKASEQCVVLTNLVALEAKVFADPRRLEQMLTNLVENAIKFNHLNGQVTIGFERATHGEQALAVSTTHFNEAIVNPAPGETTGRDKIVVADTGEGIPAQHLERLFERFYRVDRARSREMGGTGLGLAIVKHLARAHGGEVSVTSQLGKGSSFTVELPHRRPTDR